MSDYVVFWMRHNERPVFTPEELDAAIWSMTNSTYLIMGMRKTTELFRRVFG